MELLATLATVGSAIGKGALTAGTAVGKGALAGAKWLGKAATAPELAMLGGKVSAPQIAVGMAMRQLPGLLQSGAPQQSLLSAPSGTVVGGGERALRYPQIIIPEKPRRRFLSQALLGG